MANYTELNKQEKDVTAKQEQFAEIADKIDKIYKYTRSTRRWAVFRGLMSFIFFLIFIVGPIVGSFYLAQYLKEKEINFESLTGQFTEFQDVIDQFKGASSGINNIFDKLPGGSN